MKRPRLEQEDHSAYQSLEKVSLLPSSTLYELSKSMDHIINMKGTIGLNFVG